MTTFTIPITVPGAKSRGLSRRARLILSRLLVLVVLAGTWQLLYWSGALPEVAPDIGQIVTALAAVLLSAAFWVAVGQTLFGAFSGWGIAAVVGVVLGVAIGTNGFLSRSVGVVVEFGRSFPMLALMPVIVLVIGVNARMEILMVFLSCLWPILIQAIAGSRRQDQAVADTVAVFRISPLRRFWRVTVPGALPLISTGLRIAASISILVAVGVGVLSQTPGLGRQITMAQEASRWDVAFAYIIFAGLVGWALNSAIAAVESRALKWNRQEA
ncbi:ABC transporter permease subunit [Leucobacter rhizosphaerae]|uniref:ABC transporter permease subunit n=1 Tax=Leucobacter rhizosphaerae TaxID=2932245 RepID=A0ABY4FSD5_9MICO|nr:ABC transporter permease subunit [Leucobacter rhizosphaerae]UOQ59079.1 ABC transporter permease subunit [Leucobacter rhizosphaerae]